MEKSFQDYKNTGNQKHTLTFFIFLVFIAVLIFIIYTSFKSPESSITGNIIKNSNLKVESMQINAKLTPPENLNLETQSEKISLKTKTPSIFYLNNQKFELESKSSLIIDNFKGKISINLQNISKLEGETTKVYINGIPVTPPKKSQISFKENFDYSLLKIKNLQTSLEYITSGDINIKNGKIKIRLDNEKIVLKNFQGDLELSNDLRLEGFIPKSDMKNFLESNLLNQKTNSITTPAT